MTVRQLLNVLEDNVRIYLVNSENELEYLRFTFDIKFTELKPYLTYKVVSVKPLVANEIRIEYKKEIK